MAIKMNYITLLAFSAPALTDALTTEIEVALTKLNDDLEDDTDAEGMQSAKKDRGFQPLYRCPQNCGPQHAQHASVADFHLFGGGLQFAEAQEWFSVPKNAGQPYKSKTKPDDKSVFLVRDSRMGALKQRIACYGFRTLDRRHAKRIVDKIVPWLDGIDGYLGELLIQVKTDWDA